MYHSKLAQRRVQSASQRGPELGEVLVGEVELARAVVLDHQLPARHGRLEQLPGARVDTPRDGQPVAAAHVGEALEVAVGDGAEEEAGALPPLLLLEELGLAAGQRPRREDVLGPQRREERVRLPAGGKAAESGGRGMFAWSA